MSEERKHHYILLAVLNIVCLGAFALTFFMLSAKVNSLPSQLAAKRWSAGDGAKTSQVSVFFAGKLGMELNDIYKARTDIEKKLKEYSVSSKEPDKRAWADAFSAEDVLTVTSPRTDYTITSEVAVTAVGGDYFLIHPLKIVSGYYFGGDDLMRDRVVLDENLAWQLFGSSDIAGMTVLVGERRLTVAGVVEAAKNEREKYTYGDKPRMYMSYEELAAIKGKNPAVTCYEAVLPDTVKGLAKKIVSEVIKEDGKTVQIIENTSRFSLKNLFAMITDGGKRSVINTEVTYPYWENDARMAEDSAAEMLTLIIAELIVPLLTVIGLFALLIRRRKLIIKKAAEKIKSVAYNLKRN